MANNFKNAVRRNISADSTLPTEIYKAPDTKKSIAIEIDVSNKSSAGVTVTVQLEDESQNEAGGDAHTVTVTTGVSGLITTTNAAAHNLIINDRVIFGGTALVLQMHHCHLVVKLPFLQLDCIMYNLYHQQVLLRLQKLKVEHY